jgi:RNA polymerase sigma factor (sigma-70 family)
MATTALGTVLHNLRRCLLRQDEAGLTDGDLLECFITERDEGAFEALVRRHGPMVLGVCRRILRNEADAEDAFQATFLVLVRKAASIRPRVRVGNWLYGVAHSTALKARAMRTTRLAKEREAAARLKPEDSAETWDQLSTLLDQELKALPDKYRTAIVLCDLEGKSIKEAAQQLGCPQATVGTRLARGRRLLARRLGRHGLALSAGVITSAIAQNAAAAGVPPLLMSSTVKAALSVAAGQAAATGVIPAKVAALTEGVLQAMFLTKLKITVAMLLAVVIVAAGAGAVLLPARAAQVPQPRKAERPATQHEGKLTAHSPGWRISGSVAVASTSSGAGRTGANRHSLAGV